MSLSQSIRCVVDRMESANFHYWLPDLLAHRIRTRVKRDFDLDVLLVQMVQLALELGRQGVSLQRRSLKAEG